MRYLEGQKLVVDVLEETSNIVAKNIREAKVVDKEFLVSQLDKFFSLTYLVKFELQRALEEEAYNREHSGGVGLENMLDEIFGDMLSKLNKESGL